MPGPTCPSRFAPVPTRCRVDSRPVEDAPPSDVEFRLLAFSRPERYGEPLMIPPLCDDASPAYPRRRYGQPGPKPKPKPKPKPEPIPRPRGLPQPLAILRRGRACQLRPLPDRTLRHSRCPQAPANPPRRYRKRLRLRTKRHLPESRRFHKPRPHRPLQTRLLRPGGETGQRQNRALRQAGPPQSEETGNRRERNRRMGRGHAGGPRPGRTVRPRPARLRTHAPIPRRRGRGPHLRALRRLHTPGSDLHSLSRPPLPSHQAPRSVPGIHPRTPPPGLDRPASARPEPDHRQGHSRRGGPPGNPGEVPRTIGTRPRGRGPVPHALPVHILRRRRGLAPEGQLYRLAPEPQRPGERLSRYGFLDSGGKG